MWMLRREERRVPPQIAEAVPERASPLDGPDIPASHPLLVQAPGGPVLKRLMA
tara:strand:- start:1841 stop:1999 length:159 start_codon:yes stop_codon:yes gene_type:complete